MIADQQTGVLAGRALVRDATRLWVTGEDRRIAPSAAKLFCTEMVGKVADLAVQVHGGMGYMKERPKNASTAMLGSRASTRAPARSSASSSVEVW